MTLKLSSILDVGDSPQCISPNAKLMEICVLWSSSERIRSPLPRKSKCLRMKKIYFFNRSWKISWSLLHLWNQELYCIWVRILSQWESLYLPSKDENCLWRRCEVHHLSNTWRSWLSPSEWDPFPRYQALKHSFWSMWKCQDYRFWPI